MKKSNKNNKHIKMLIDLRYKVHLFTRKSNIIKSEMKGAPFTYQGLVKSLIINGKDPVNIIWKVEKNDISFIDLNDLFEEIDSLNKLIISFLIQQTKLLK